MADDADGKKVGHGAACATVTARRRRAMTAEAGTSGLAAVALAALRHLHLALGDIRDDGDRIVGIDAVIQGLVVDRDFVALLQVWHGDRFGNFGELRIVFQRDGAAGCVPVGHRGGDAVAKSGGKAQATKPAARKSARADMSEILSGFD